MNEQENSDSGRLAVAGSGPASLTSVGSGNPLVSRGFKEIASRLDLRHALAFYFRGVALYEANKNEEAVKELDEAIRVFGEIIRQDCAATFAYRHRGKAMWLKSHARESILDEAGHPHPFTNH